jgi:hypothetical protein
MNCAPACGQAGEAGSRDKDCGWTVSTVTVHQLSRQSRDELTVYIATTHDSHSLIVSFFPSQLMLSTALYC